MTSVRAQTEIAVPPERAWEAIAPFDSLDRWHPAIEECSLGDGGDVRRVVLATGDETVERLVRYDDDDRAYEYELVDGPMPVTEYRSTLSVAAGEGDRSFVTWESEFTPADGVAEGETEEMISGFLEAGLAGLEEQLTG